MNGKKLKSFAAPVVWGSVFVLSMNGQAQNIQGEISPDVCSFPMVITGTVDSAVTDSVARQIKSESTALNYSLLLTLVPTATLFLVVPGLIVGPSTGYFYAGMPGRAWTGIGLRTVGIGGMVSSFAIYGMNCGPGQDAYNLAWAVFITGAAITAGSAIYDISTVKAAVRRKNEALSSALGRIMLAYFADSKAFGLRMQFSF